MGFHHKILSWALIFLLRLRFLPGKSIATVLPGKFVTAQPLVFAVSFAIVTYLLTLLSLHDSWVSNGASAVDTKISQFTIFVTDFNSNTTTGHTILAREAE